MKAEKIVEAVLTELSIRKGLDIEEIVDDVEIFQEIKDSLFEIVQRELDEP